MTLRSGAFENGDRDRRLFDAAQAAAVLGQRDFGVGDLARAGLTAELSDEFEHLPEPGRADRVTFRIRGRPMD